MISIKVNDLTEKQLKRKLFLTGLLNVSWLTITFLLLLNLLLSIIMCPLPKRCSDIYIYAPLLGGVVGVMILVLSPVRYIVVSRKLTLSKLKWCMSVTFWLTILYASCMWGILLFRFDFFVIYDEVMDRTYSAIESLIVLSCGCGLWIISFLILLFFKNVFLVRPELLRQGEQYSLEQLKKLSMKRLYFLFAVKRLPAIFLWIARVSFLIICWYLCREPYWCNDFEFEWACWGWGISLAITILSSIFSCIYFRLIGCRFPVSAAFLDEVIADNKKS